jgi:hypothetical protein
VKVVRHRFSDNREAQAFICGVNWINDSMIDVIDVEVGDEDDGEGGRRLVATVVCNEQEESDTHDYIVVTEELYDHRDHL